MAKRTQFSLEKSKAPFRVLRGLVLEANLISFQIRVGAMPAGNKLGLAAREIDDRDLPRAHLVLGQLRARNRPIPAAIFAERLVRGLESMRDEGLSAAVVRAG